MTGGANSIQHRLREELENYIKSQYFGKSSLILSAVGDQLDDEGLLYQKPYIESSPAYLTAADGIKNAEIPDWLKAYFLDMADSGLGVFPSPFVHQIQALEAACRGEDLFVATGTGSGKTECFMWPMVAKLITEAKENPYTWSKRGVRVIIMYPMNALVADQVSRLRKMIGDPDNQYINIFRKYSGTDSRRPQFGMYTGRTPYPGAEINKSNDQALARTLRAMVPENGEDMPFYKQLLQDGKIPAKTDMAAFLRRLKDDRHIPNEEDAELITRFEMQQFCPDILITNYSMLEYMLLRPREKKIWDNTKEWLNASSDNQLLFIIDEAHMYRGSAGGEVAFLIRRLFHKLGIQRKQIQFILTTASMPNKDEEDKESVQTFANALTAGTGRFTYLTGERESIKNGGSKEIPVDAIVSSKPEDFEETETDERLSVLNHFWQTADTSLHSFSTLDECYTWMYYHLLDYSPFYRLISRCRGDAVSLNELASFIFPNVDADNALNGVSVLLAIAPLAKSEHGAVLFPARMHMLFRGIKGVYACTNPMCKCASHGAGITLGEVFLSDGKLVCPECGCMVYELYNDRRCGALFYKGYVSSNDGNLAEDSFLWHFPGQLMDRAMKELHLYIPPDDFVPPKGRTRNQILPCYLDIHSGFLYFGDDTKADNSNYRKLYYCNYSAKGHPEIMM